MTGIACGIVVLYDGHDNRFVHAAQPLWLPLGLPVAATLAKKHTMLMLKLNSATLLTALLPSVAANQKGMADA